MGGGAAYESAEDVAIELLDLLGIDDVRVEEYGVFGDGVFHLASTTGPDDAACVIRLGHLNTPPHYFLLQTLNGAEELSPSGGDLTKGQNGLFYGVVNVTPVSPQLPL